MPDETSFPDILARLRPEPECAVEALPEAEAEALLSPAEEGPRLDLRSQGEPWGRRFDAGRAMRAALPREALADWSPPAARPDPIVLVRAAERGRQPEFLPLRRERMAASPFSFLRGTAGIMAADLSGLARTGIEVVANGDAHLANFGLFGTPTGDVVMDLNDFDEVAIGPWEHDILRLAASVAVAAADEGLPPAAREEAVRAVAAGYCQTVRRLAPLGAAEVWAEATHLERGSSGFLGDPAAEAVLDAAVARARRRDSRKLLRHAGERRVDGGWRIRAEPPVTSTVPEALREAVISALERYADTLPRERRYLLQRYRCVDVAHRVVGVGSVGLRAYLALLFGNSDHDALFLQCKEAAPPAARPFLPGRPRLGRGHEGERVVHGQRLLQAVGDPFLGWTSVEGRPFYVRQMRNLKGDVTLPWPAPRALHAFLHAYGALLARAHARTGDAAAISGWCGGGRTLGHALAAFAERYAAQVRADHAAYREGGAE